MNGKRILLIDDDENITETLVLALEAEGFTVDSAKTGKDAIVKSFENFYNLAVVDWRLPDIEGTNLLGELKQTTPKMAKIMLTGFPSMDNAIDAVNSKADAFLVKPVHFEKLLETINNLLEQQETDGNYSEEKMTNFIETRVKMLTRKDLKM
ncbi:MAG: response regulator [Candidatus Bathyarchaeota archaeon]|nr:response regulator [Candidatus Bathyarchaeum tardum]WGM90642.1 MAG: response regulator [Candidatus Bathyarchaeum tardum]